MTSLRNQSPWGDVEAFGRVVPAGADVEFPDEQAKRLLETPLHWALTPAEKPAKEKS